MYFQSVNRLGSKSGPTFSVINIDVRVYDNIIMDLQQKCLQQSRGNRSIRHISSKSTTKLQSV